MPLRRPAPVLHNHVNLQTDRRMRLFMLSLTNLRNEELGSLVGGLVCVEEVVREDKESAPADGVGGSAVDVCPISGIVGDLLIVLGVLGVTKEHDTLDLLLDGVVELTHTSRHDCCSLAVTAGYDGGVGALLVCQVEEPLGFAKSSLTGASGKEVGGQVGEVRASDALDPEIISVLVCEL